MRQLESNFYKGMKVATKRLVGAFGKQEIAAMSTRVNHVSLSNYCNLGSEQEATFIPVDVMADLTKVSGDMSLLEYLADMFGKNLIDKPTGEAGHQAQKIQSAIKEMGEAIAAAADNCTREKKLKELREAGSAIADLIASIEADTAK